MSAGFCDVTDWKALWCSLGFCRYKDADSLAYFHDAEHDGLVRIGRLALQLKYPDYAEKGYEAFLAKPPVIYVSAAAPREVSELLCTQASRSDRSR